MVAQRSASAFLRKNMVAQRSASTFLRKNMVAQLSYHLLHY
jgi:hypothetical protein